MPNGHTDAERITAVEVELREIKTNHLPHIQDALNRLNDSTDRKHSSIDESLSKVRTLLISGLITLIFILIGTVINLLT